MTGPHPLWNIGEAFGELVPRDVLYDVHERALKAEIAAGDAKRELELERRENSRLRDEIAELRRELASVEASSIELMKGSQKVIDAKNVRINELERRLRGGHR